MSRKSVSGVSQICRHGDGMGKILRVVMVTWSMRQAAGENRPFVQSWSFGSASVTWKTRSHLISKEATDPVSASTKKRLTGFLEDVRKLCLRYRIFTRCNQKVQRNVLKYFISNNLCEIYPHTFIVLRTLLTTSVKMPSFSKLKCIKICLRSTIT